ncbi:MAG: efflux RND transporter periplasmic adaptor subunit [Pseudomonadota bacterium]
MSNKSELLDQLKIDRTQKPAQGMKLAAVVGVAIVAAIAGAAVTAWLAPEGRSEVTAAAASTVGSETQPSSASGNIAEASPATRTVSTSEQILNASGYVTARRIATVSSQITGLITEVNVEEGMIVEAGQVLARLDSALAQVDYDLAVARLASQRATVETTRANLSEAERVYNRAERLRPQNLVSEADLTQAAASFDAQRATLERTQADLAVLQLEIARQRERLDDHVITAPFAGVVTVKNAQKGEIVSPGSAGGGFTRTGICTIVDMDSLEIEVDVNEAFIGRVFTGQRVLANLDAYPDWDIAASVVAIIPTADRAKATVKVRIGIDDRDQRILPDMGVKVAFLRSENE